MVILDEKKYSSKAKSINELTEKLTSINWYSQIGKEEQDAEQALSDLLDSLKVDKYEIKWIKEHELNDVLGKIKLSGSPVWDKLKDFPAQLKRVIEDKNEEDLLESVIDIVPERVFHSVFDHAFKTFGKEKLVQFFVGQALYFSILICVSEIAGKSEMSSKFLTLLQTGHVPIGLNGNKIYII